MTAPQPRPEWDDSIDLRKLVDALIRYKFLIVGVVVAVVGVAAVFSYLVQTPRFESTAGAVLPPANGEGGLGLAGPVRDIARDAFQRLLRSDVNDSTPAVFNHVRQRCLGHDVCALEVDLEQPGDVLVRHLGDRRLRHPRADEVDQYVDLAVVLNRALNSGASRSGIGGVKPSPVWFRSVRISLDDGRARGCEHIADAGPQPASGASHQSDAARQNPALSHVFPQFRNART